MGFLSNIFKKDKKLWKDFDGLQNDKDTLWKKAEVVCPIIFSNAEGMAKIFQRDIFCSVSWENLFLEALIINLYMFDRYAFQFLGSKNRNIFMDYLCSFTDDNLDIYVKDSNKIDKVKEHFFNKYQKRQIEYGNCEIISQKNEEGGFNITNTVGWKLSEILSDYSGLDDMSKENMISGLKANSLISDYFLDTLKRMQIPELFKGY